MKVEQLARFVGLGIEDVVAVILGAPRAHREQHRVRPTVVVPPSPPAATSGEPLRAAMVGHATYHDVHRVVDRWLLTRVLDEERGNVSHAAQRLRVSRRTLRERWARVRDRAAAPAPAPAPAEAENEAPGATAEAPPSLGELLARGRTYAEIRDAVDRWLIGGTLAGEHGNVSRTARRLGIVRKQVRERWARVRPQ